MVLVVLFLDLVLYLCEPKECAQLMPTLFIFYLLIEAKLKFIFHLTIAAHVIILIVFDLQSEPALFVV